MRVVAVVFFLCLVALCAAKRPRWNELEGYTFSRYLKDFGRRYNGDELRMREKVFNAKLESIRAHNADPTQTYKRGVNQYTDMTAEEWRRFNALKKSADTLPETRTIVAPDALNVQLPLYVDYREWSAPRVLTAVKHQGSCGNCWAHAATESLESYFALLTGRLPTLSTQQITACTPASLNCSGCNGGFQSAAWTYLNSTYHGETEEWAYPFTNFFFNVSDPNAETDACRNVTGMYPNTTPYQWFAELTRVGVNGFNRIRTNDAQSTMFALATIGPLAIDVAAGNWQDYEVGVFQNTASNGNVSEWQVDHAVQMVGYGFDKALGMNYWIVRNSWSTNWGEDGFIRLHRPATEPCGPVDVNGGVEHAAQAAASCRRRTRS
jgi:cathepsin L